MIRAYIFSMSIKLALLACLMRATDRAIVTAGNLHRATLAWLSTHYITALAKRNAARDHHAHTTQARPVLAQVRKSEAGAVTAEYLLLALTVFAGATLLAALGALYIYAPQLLLGLPIRAGA